MEDGADVFGAGRDPHLVWSRVGGGHPSHHRLRHALVRAVRDREQGARNAAEALTASTSSARKSARHSAMAIVMGMIGTQCGMPYRRRAWRATLAR